MIQEQRVAQGDWRTESLLSRVRVVEDSYVSKLTEAGRRIIVLAGEQAGRFEHDYIDTGHIILALITNEEVAEFLQSVNVSPEKIKSATEFVLAGCRIIPEAGQFIACDLTKNAYRTISSSLDEAQRNKREEADTLDLFIGCLHVKDGVAAIVLESFGVTLERTQTARARLNKPLTS